MALDSYFTLGKNLVKRFRHQALSDSELFAQETCGHPDEIQKSWLTRLDSKTEPGEQGSGFASFPVNGEGMALVEACSPYEKR